jgi:hypothetical protein
MKEEAAVGLPSLKVTIMPLSYEEDNHFYRLAY